MERLAALAAAHGLDARFVDAMRSVLEALATEPASVSSVRDPQQAVAVHVADSLDGLSVDAVRTARRVADIGSGAGFPALVLAAALPQAEVVAIESVGRKAAFIEGVARRADLANVGVVHGRVEEWDAGDGCDVVTARAVAPLATLVEYAAPVLRLGGSLVAWKGRRDAAEEDDGARAAAAVGLRDDDVIEIPARDGARSRHLHLYSKVSPTPTRFPRRAGMARKRPLAP